MSVSCTQCEEYLGVIESANNSAKRRGQQLRQLIQSLETLLYKSKDGSWYVSTNEADIDKVVKVLEGINAN